MKIPIDALPSIPVYQETYCDQELTDRLCAHVWENMRRLLNGGISSSLLDVARRVVSSDNVAPVLIAMELRYRLWFMCGIPTYEQIKPSKKKAFTP